MHNKIITTIKPYKDFHTNTLSKYWANELSKEHYSMHTIYKFEWLMETRHNAEGNDDVQQMNQVKIITKNESTMLIVIN